MGNCIDYQKASTWVDDNDDWESEESDNKASDELVGGDEKLGNGVNLASCEVKIKITKKQLEELLWQAKVRGLPIKQVLSDLLNSREEDGVCDRGRHWKPALQSIPEICE